MIRKGIAVQDVFDAARDAGREFARNGKISERNLKIVSRDLVSLEKYVEMTNKGFKQALDRLDSTRLHS
jgi:phosphoenolpyruvate synthase/pyruvate phosphate dikinase